MRLADLRTTIKDLAEAKAVFDRYAALTLQVEALDAKLEFRIAQIKEKHKADTSQQASEAAEMQDSLVAWINQNKDKFKDPKTVATNMGAFGLRKVTDLVIVDEEHLLNDVKSKGLEDCYQTHETPVKTAIKKLLKAGVEIKGAVLREGETATCTIAKALLEEAKRV